MAFETERRIQFEHETRLADGESAIGEQAASSPIQTWFSAALRSVPVFGPVRARHQRSCPRPLLPFARASVC
jgi:hypothetical protein